MRRYQTKKVARARLVETCNLQRLLKGIYVRKIIHKKLKAIPVIQKQLPMFVARYKFKKFKKAIVKLQALYRMRKIRKIYLAQKKEKTQKA